MPQYQYRPAPPWGQSFAQTMVGRIILINVVVFVIQNIFPAFTPIFALTPRLVVQNFFVWQIFTYMFLHGGLMHILFNMFILWMFGSTIESAWGGRQFLRYYLFCGIGGALFSLIFTYHASVIGASGAIFGLYIAYALMFPDSYIYLYFLFPVKAKYFVTGLAVLQLANGLAGPSGIAYFAHLGGAAAGLLFFRTTLLQRARFSLGAQRRWRKHMNERNQQPPTPPEHPESDNIDSILDKISAKGYDNLSSIEKRILENYSRKRKENND